MELMERIPAEIWEMILGNLLNTKDCENASNASPVWKNILSSSKQLWLFCPTFPVLLERFSKSDILQCRLVCKHWCYGVDHFLENNPYHRPAAIIDAWKADDHKTDNFCREFIRGLNLENNLAYHLFSKPQRNLGILLKEATTHPRCPIISRSALISVRSSTQVQSQNSRFLKAFGHHILFITISIHGLSALRTVTHILELLQFVPNLKKLNVYSTLRIHTEVIRRQLADYVNKERNEQARENLPKLETLELMECDPEIKQALLRLLCTKKLQTLYMTLERSLCNFETRNIVNLHITVDSERHLLHLLQLESPVQKLALNLRERVRPATLFKAVKHFQKTVRDLEISLLPNFYWFPAFAREEWQSRLEPFRNKEILSGFLQLKRVTLEGFHPLSLNFLCGLHASLEYLHFLMQDFGRSESLIEPVVNMIGSTDELNLLDYLKCRPCSLSEKRKIYQSKVWTVLPRLKVLSVQWKDELYLKTNELVYRRDLFEKLLPTSSPS